MDTFVLVANVICWGALVVVWIALAIRDGGSRPAARVRGSTDIGSAVVAVVAIATILLLGRAVLSPLSVETAWARVVGAIVLVTSMLFAIWARVALGTSWTVGPQASTERGLRTDGPYAITRHPIYTGLVGMLIGSALLGGLGRWIVLVLAGIVVVELKIRSEERLLKATFPSAYDAYREHVPQLVPGWRRLTGLRADPDQHQDDGQG